MIKTAAFLVAFIYCFSANCQTYKEYYYWKFTYLIAADRKGIDTSISNFIIIDSAGTLTVQDALIGTKNTLGKYIVDGAKSVFIPSSNSSEKFHVYDLHDTLNLKYSSSPSFFPKGRVYNTGLDTMIENQRYLKFTRYYKGQPGIGDVGHYSEEYIDPITFIPKFMDIRYEKGMKVRRIQIFNYAVTDHATGNKKNKN